MPAMAHSVNYTNASWRTAGAVFWPCMVIGSYHWVHAVWAQPCPSALPGEWKRNADEKAAVWGWRRCPLTLPVFKYYGWHWRGGVKLSRKGTLMRKWNHSKRSPGRMVYFMCQLGEAVVFSLVKHWFGCCCEGIFQIWLTFIIPSL